MQKQKQSYRSELSGFSVGPPLMSEVVFGGKPRETFMMAEKQGVNARWNSLERCLHTQRQKVPHQDATRAHDSIREPEPRPS